MTDLMGPEEELDAWRRWRGPDLVTEREQERLQALHDARAKADPAHDRGGCWCCCSDCEPKELW